MKSIAPMRVARSVDAAVRDHPLPLKTIGFVLLLCLLWGGLMVSIKVALEGLPPILLAGIRFMIGAGCILAWTWIARIPLRPRAGEGRSIVGVGLVLVVQIVTMNLGAQHTTASHAVVLLQTYPFFVALIAHFAIPGDRLTASKGAGLILACAGMVGTMADRLDIPGSWAGDWLSLLSAVLLGTQTVLIKRLVTRIGPAVLLFWQMAVAVPLFFVLSLLLERHVGYHLSAGILTAVAYQGIVIAGFCFVAWTILLKSHSASRLSAFFFSTPLFGVTLSWLLLGDRITIRLLAGLVLLASGLYVINTRHQGSTPPLVE